MNRITFNRLNISEEEVEAFNRACKIESELGIPLEASEIDTGASLNTGVLDFPHDEESYGVGPL